MEAVLRLPFFMGDNKHNSAPLIIGATGGSGTRAFTNLLANTGRVYLGNNHNPAMDCLDFKSFYDEYVLWGARILFNTDTVNDGYDTLRGSFDTCFEQYLSSAVDTVSNIDVWGWKGPRSMFLLPFFEQYFSAMKFLHVVRDGRDMAYSQNQNQLRLYGEELIGNEVNDLPLAQASISLWQSANISVAEYGRKKLGARYLCVRYEDLVFDSDQTLGQIAEFLGIELNALLRSKDVLVPSSGCGRWRNQPRQEVNSVLRAGSRGLYYFGYQ